MVFNRALALPVSSSARALTPTIDPTWPPYFPDFSHASTTPLPPTSAARGAPAHLAVPFLDHVPDVIAPVRAADGIDEIDEQQRPKKGSKDDSGNTATRDT